WAGRRIEIRSGQDQSGLVPEYGRDLESACSWHGRCSIAAFACLQACECETNIRSNAIEL
ncbi:MAG TPA: hypothetical protein VE860_09255, partial [Chthoniobacterales bacterium]|nr:hypothetical protein [Chthoniobacterales bacterium]